MPPAAKLVVGITVVMVLASCGDERPRGEPGGVPIAFSVDLDWRYVDQIARTVVRPAPLFVPPPAYGYGGRYRYYGRPYGYYRTDPFWYDTGPGWTDVLLLGGDGPAEAGVFRVPLSSGHQEFTVPIRAGHTVTLTVQARGDREGWEAVGHFTAAENPGQRVHLQLDAQGPRMEVTLPEYGPPPPPPAAPAP